MYILTVAPIRKGIPIAELSYISKEAPEIGAVILVPIRKKDTPAIVLNVNSAINAKAAIKGAGFSLRKIDSIKIINNFSPAFIEAAKEVSKYYIATLGSTIQAVFPSILINDNKDNFVEIKEEILNNETGAAYIPSILQAEEAERIAIYKSHIREVFAKNGSVFFVLPTIQDIEKVDSLLGKGIGSYTHILHSNLTKKQLSERLNDIKNSDHPTLIIATPQFLAVPCKNLQSIILERESASSYTMTHRPYIDLRKFVELYARERKIPLLFGDLFLRIETLVSFENGEFDSVNRPKARYSNTATPYLVDMRESKEQPAIGKVAFFSKKLVSLISETRKRGASTFILCVRRGVSPMTVCGDCGTIVECKNCESPLILHRKFINKDSEDNIEYENSDNITEGDTEQTLPHKDIEIDKPIKKEFENIFICHKCGDKSEPRHKCNNCGSWRFTMLGIGIEQAEDILKNHFSDCPIFRIDTDSLKTHKEARERIQLFYSTPGAILLGTEMAIPYLSDNIGLVSVLSVNSLLTIPDFKMNEHVFRLLLVLREKARDNFLIQTREQHQIFNLALKGNIGEFVQEELALRKELMFPPYSIFIKLTFEGNKYDAQSFLSSLQSKLNEIGVNNINYPDYAKKKGNNIEISTLISIPKKLWPNEKLLQYLESLPPNISIKVDPKSIIGD